MFPAKVLVFEANNYNFGNISVCESIPSLVYKYSFNVVLGNTSPVVISIVNCRDKQKIRHTSNRQLHQIS